MQREDVRVGDAVQTQPERDPEAHRQALAERAGRDLDPGRPGHVRVALEMRVQLAQAHQVLVREVAVPGQRRVLDRRRVPLGEHEAVAAGPARRRWDRGAAPGSRAPPRCPPPTARCPGGPTSPPRASARSRSAARSRAAPAPESSAGASRAAPWTPIGRRLDGREVRRALALAHDRLEILLTTVPVDVARPLWRSYGLRGCRPVLRRPGTALRRMLPAGGTDGQ